VSSVHDVAQYDMANTRISTADTKGGLLDVAAFISLASYCRSVCERKKGNVKKWKKSRSDNGLSVKTH
jgi:hypothetical protein